MFSTEVKISPSSYNITYEDNIMTLGSCFSENIGNKLQQACFSVQVNPFGVLYNPVSICNSIDILLQGKYFTEKDLFFDGNLWHSFSHSSLFSGVEKDDVLKKINQQIKQTRSYLEKTDYLLITFGTAWVFEHVDSGEVVSNCHKLPARGFVRYRLTVEDIVARYAELIVKLNDLKPDMKIVFTVSPIRHWKDGAHENNLSKGILLLAIEALKEQFENIIYFPAYEIQLDELRDYRYYADDMLHPSAVAVEHIWNRFSQTYFSASTQEQKKELEQLKADMSHRPLHPESPAYVDFLKKTEQRRECLLQKYPYLKNRLE